MAEEVGSRENGDGRVRMGRRGFIGAGLTAAGAVAATRAPWAAGQGGDRQGSPPPAAGSISQLPTRGTYPNLPAIPVDAAGVADTVPRLELREEQMLEAKQGLTRNFTINGKTRPAYEFLFDAVGSSARSDARRALAQSVRDNPEGAPLEIARNLDRRGLPAATANPLSLEHPEQFSISWTTFPDVYGSGVGRLDEWASSLSDADSATRQFWPTIANYGYGYNLIIPERVTRARARELRPQFGAAWTRKVRKALADGNLYVIDMSRFEALAPPQSVNGAPRFTPATVTLLTRNPRKQSLTPVAVIVSGSGGSGRTVYSRAKASDDAWLYALQAAKASVTLYGVWIGHVYHWHIVTAAMQMAMFNTLPTDHPVYLLLAPQSKYVIPFDDVLLAEWSAIAPPTSLVTPEDFLGLSNDFADGRSFFDDDPKTTIKQLGLRRKDFSARSAWDRYPVVGQLLRIWNLVEAYVDTFVSSTYASDAAVAADGDLQTWIATAASPDPSTGGNVKGLPEMNTRAALGSVLTSLLYRVTAHGISRLSSTPNPALTFTANYPHCLQRTDIPGPRARISTRELLAYLPNTDTIGQSVDFYFVFVFSTPYEPYIPLGGVGKELFFPGGSGDARNRALMDLRKGLAAFIEDYQPDMPQRYQWERNIET